MNPSFNSLQGKLKLFLIFQWKITPAAFIIASIMGFVGASLNNQSFLWNTRLAYFLLLILMHYLAYEVRNPDDYYFYYNRGINKITLWASTLVHYLTFHLISIIL